MKKTEKHSWIEQSPAEIEELVVKLAQEGKSPPEIGMILRDVYGIPKVKKVLGMSILQILKKHNLQPKIPYDLMCLIRKSVALQKHLSAHKKDFTAKRGYQLTVAKIRKLARYYIRRGYLPKDWRYSAEEAALLVK